MTTVASITAADVAAGIGLGTMTAIIVIAVVVLAAAAIAHTRPARGAHHRRLHHTTQVRDLTDDEYQQQKGRQP